MGTPWGPPRVPGLEIYVSGDRFWTIFGRPGGGPGTLEALGPLWALLGAPGGVFWRLRGDLGGGRAGGLKIKRLGVHVSSVLGALFVHVSGLLGASPALFFDVFCSWCLGRFGLPFSSLFAARGTGEHA